MTRREAIAVLLAGPLVVARPCGARAQAPDPTAWTVAEALAALSRGEVTPLELTDAYLDRIARLNPGWNAFVTVTAAQARREAERVAERVAERDARSVARSDARSDARGMLAGIPIAHKDLFETAGIRTTAGSRLFDEHVPTANAALVEALSRAGAVTLGKTNTHELGGGVTTINPFYGTTRNPADPSRIPGGSSGGSAAAVAGRLAAAATGSDTGGSVRIPAAFCGCVGFKPTLGRLSTAGLLGASPTFDHVGFLTRTVEDAEILFHAARAATEAVRRAGTSVPATPDAVSPDTATAGTATAGTATADAAAPIRVGIPRAYFFDNLDADVADATARAIARARAQGALVDDIAFPIDARTMSIVFDPIVTFEIWSRYGVDWRLQPALFSEAFAAFFATERPPVAAVDEARAALEAYRSAVDRLFDGVDVLLMPAVPLTAPAIDGPIDGMRILRNTWPFNAAGTPAISVPIHTAGLPVGLQLVARRHDDDKLLRIARTLTGA